MDPIANLREQLEIAARWVECCHDGCDCPRDMDRMAELVIALDEWMRKGGFSPWRKGKYGK